MRHEYQKSETSPATTPAVTPPTGTPSQGRAHGGAPGAPLKALLCAALTMLALAVSVAPLAAQPGDNPPGGGAGGERPSFPPPPDAPEAVPGQLIVKFEEDATRAQEADARRDEGLRKVEDLGLIDAEVAKVSGQPVEQAVGDLERRPDVAYAEPNRISYPAGYADEARFGELWGLNNTGQTVDNSAGTADVDVDALEASAVTQGDSGLVAVIDSGTDFSHPDLADRAWVNPGESGAGKETNGVDDDANGYVDDVNGWNFCNDTPRPFTPGDSPHGTHVAGTVAASADGRGVVGVAPEAKIMALKFGCGANGDGSIANQIRALDYARKMGAKISNFSYGGAGGSSQAEQSAIEAYGGLFVASAGNDRQNNDTSWYRNYPASYDSPNILSVAAVGNRGGLASFSNYGATTVDVSAPGVGILSSLPDSGYDYYDGTSMAAPHVTGVAALAASVTPGLQEKPDVLKRIVLKGTKPLPATTGKTVTGGMVDAHAAVLAADAPAVVGSTPANGAKRVSPGANVEAVFSEGMDPGTLAPDSFTLTRQGGGAPVPAAVTYDAGSRTATLDPAAGLDPNVVTYTATVKSGADGPKDRSGKAMDGDESWSFVVSDDLRAPGISIEAPEAGAFTNDDRPAISGKAGTEPGDSETVAVKLYVGAGVSGPVRQTLSATRSADGSYAVWPEGALPNGIYTAVAEQQDASENVGASAPVGFTVDTRAPVVTVAGSPVAAWGHNAYGQSRAPGSLVNVEAVAGGYDHSLALKRDGTVAAWGLNGDGQADVPGGLSRVEAVSAGFYHNLALKDDGTVAAWGYDEFGQATVPDDLTNVKAVSSGGYHNLAVKDDGTVAAWGRNSSGQLNIPSGLTGVTEISAGTEHNLALKDNGEVVAWGRDLFGETDVPEAARSGVEAVSAGGYFSLALKENGEVVAWGQNSSGQRNVPAEVQGSVAQISAGSSHALALKDDGTVAAWGNNLRGQTNVPANLTGVRSVDAGGSHALAVVADARTENPTPSFEFSADEQVRGFECRVDADGFVPCSSPFTAAKLLDGEHAFEVRTTDRAGNVGTGSRSFLVDAPPSAGDDPDYRTGEDSPLTVSAADGVLANDTNPDGGPLEAVKVSEPENGTVDLNSEGSFTYAPAPDFHGSDGFTYSASDGKAGSNTATASITVAPANDAPTFTMGPDQAVDEDAGPQTVERWATDILAGPPDESGQPVSFALTADDPGLFSARPKLSPDGTLTYTPASNKNGRTTVSVAASDAPEDTGSDAAAAAAPASHPSFVIAVRAVNDAPEARDDAAGTKNGAPVSIDVLANDGDPDGDALAVAAVSDPAHAKATIADDAIRYAPDAGYAGPDSFSYTVEDGQGGTATATVSLTVKDAARPQTTITAGPSGIVRNASATFRFSSDEAGSAFGCSLDNSAFRPCSSPKAYSGLEDGRHTFKVEAVDRVGNADPTPAARAWTVDTANPTIGDVSTSLASVDRDRTLTIKATVRDKLTNLRKGDVRLFVDGKRTDKFGYNPRTDRLTYEPRGTFRGKKTIKVVATDAAGNVGTKSWGITIRG